ncbi:hypothetical protein KC853_02610 [Candidatus Saccharibacteria bacterium]|nr:hypothetical protein [Candidatus Saccharibacteria bacterium]MCB9834883.1 hypothetical protein [Candidatus Nomurabacteria bacterium]
MEDDAKGDKLLEYDPEKPMVAQWLERPELDDIAWELNNNKPRKRLGWHTPQEVYDWLASNPNSELDLAKVAFGNRI